MRIFKQLLVRLSDSLLANVHPVLKPKKGKKAQPALKLVSDNPHPVAAPDMPSNRTPSSVAGHAESIEEALQLRGVLVFVTSRPRSRILG